MRTGRVLKAEFFTSLGRGLARKFDRIGFDNLELTLREISHEPQ